MSQPVYRIWGFEDGGRRAVEHQAFTAGLAVERAAWVLREGSPAVVIIAPDGHAVSVERAGEGADLSEGPYPPAPGGPGAKRVEHVDLDEALGRGRHGTRTRSLSGLRPDGTYGPLGAGGAA